MDRPQPRTPRPRIGPAEIVGDGVFAGLIGASAVALWFLVIDAALREPFFTPSLVASSILHGTPPAAGHQINLTLVAIFTALHSLAFIGFGVIASWAVDQFEHTPDMPLISIGILIALELGFVTATKLVIPETAELIGHGFIFTANALAAVGMGLYLHDWQRHPEDVAAATSR